MQKLGVVTEYLTMVDTAAESSGDGLKLVRELTEEAEHRSEYRSCGSGTPKMSSSSSTSSSSSSAPFDDDDDDDDDGWNNDPDQLFCF